jgi:hypothetical protein
MIAAFEGSGILGGKWRTWREVVYLEGSDVLGVK